MIFDATLDGRTVRVDVRATGDRHTVTLDGRPVQVDACETGRDLLSFLVEGRSFEAGFERRAGGYLVMLQGSTFGVEMAEAARGAGPMIKKASSGPARVMAPMPGKIVRLLAEAGQDVVAGQGLLVMEAMKMENELRSPRAGRLLELTAREGQAVEAGALLAVVE